MYLFIRTTVTKGHDGVLTTSSSPFVSENGVLLTTQHLKGAKKLLAVLADQLNEQRHADKDYVMDWSDEEDRVDIMVDMGDKHVTHTLSLHHFGVV